MLNYIWLALIIISVIVGAINGRITQVTEAAFEYAKISVTIAFDLIGIMALWLGIMKIAEKAGLVQILARLFKPIGNKLFPDVPVEHPAMGSMILCIAASWLGLGNAATPLGLKAMEELQELNPHKEIASDAQALFLTLNTACVTLIPATIIGVRVSMGSANPQEIIGTTIFASGAATIIGVIVTKFLAKLPIFAIKSNNAKNQEVKNG